MDNLKVQTPGVGYCHFPKREDYGQAYFVGLLSEHLVYDEKKRQPWSWQVISGHERNEALDCRNYAMAAFKALAVDLDNIDRKLQASRGRVSFVQAASEQIGQPVLGPKKRQKSKSRRGLDNYYDDW